MNKTPSIVRCYTIWNYFCRSPPYPVWMSLLADQYLINVNESEIKYLLSAFPFSFFTGQHYFIVCNFIGNGRNVSCGSSCRRSVSLTNDLYTFVSILFPFVFTTSSDKVPSRLHQLTCTHPYIHCLKKTSTNLHLNISVNL